MKKISLLLLLATLTLSFAACSDDDTGEQYLHSTTVNIAESHLNFTAAKQTGYVVAAAPGALTAKTDASWAQASVSGDTVVVNVDVNHDVEGRSSILTVYSGTDSTNVTIQQMGMSWKYNGRSFYTFNDSVHQASFPVSNVGGELSIDAPDWVNATINDSCVNVNLTENTTGSIRTADVYMHSGPYTDTLYVIQGDLKDIINKTYTFDAYDLTKSTSTTTDANELLVEMEAQVLADTVDYEGETLVLPYIYLPENNWMIQFDFQPDSLTSYIPGGLGVGTMRNRNRRYYLYTAIVDPSVYNSLSESNQLYPGLMASDYMDMLGQWASDSEAGNYAEFFSDPDNLTNWMGQLISGITSYDGYALGIFAFSSRLADWVDEDNNINTSNLNYFAGPLNIFAYPELVEYSESGAKRSVLPIGPNRTAKPSALQLNKMLNDYKATKFGPKSGKAKLTLNKSVRINQTSPFNFLKKFNRN